MMTQIEKHGYIVGYLTKSAAKKPVSVKPAVKPAVKPIKTKAAPPAYVDPDEVNDKNDIFKGTGIVPGKAGYPDATEKKVKVKK